VSDHYAQLSYNSSYLTEFLRWNVMSSFRELNFCTHKKYLPLSSRKILKCCTCTPVWLFTRTDNEKPPAGAPPKTSKQTNNE